MSFVIGDAVKSSFGFAKENTFSQFGKWIILAILLIIPIAQAIPIGVYLKVLRNEEADLSNTKQTFIQGLLAMLVMIVFFLPLLIVNFIPILGQILALVGIFFIVPLLFQALIRFANSGNLGDAFKLGDIFKTVGDLGWGTVLIAGLVILLVCGLVSIISIIPIIGLLAPPFACFALFNYFKELFA